MQLQKIVSLLLLTVPDKAIPHKKGQKLNFKKKKNISVTENLNIPPKKQKTNKHGIFLHNYFKKFLRV